MGGRFAACVLAASCVALSGCSKVAPEKLTWHEKFHWRAADYFDDAQVIALCQAIEASDVAEIDRLVAAGADVNAKGKGNMTPLLWAFPDNKFERFQRLLAHGADPNVIIESDFGTHDAFMPGMAVAHLATGTPFAGYFTAVFEHGGNPNLAMRPLSLGRTDTPFFLVIASRRPDAMDRIRLLLDKGADVNLPGADGDTPLLAAAKGGKFDRTLLFLERGADYKRYRQNGIQRLAHLLVIEKASPASEAWPSQKKKDFKSLCDWLEAHGESFQQAEADVRRWESWPPDAYGKNAQTEIAERVSREAGAPEKQAAEPRE